MICLVLLRKNLVCGIRYTSATKARTTVPFRREADSGSRLAAAALPLLRETCRLRRGRAWGAGPPVGDVVPFLRPWEVRGHLCPAAAAKLPSYGPLQIQWLDLGKLFRPSGV